MSITDYQLKMLGRAVSRSVKEFYKNPENLRKFEEWQKSKNLENLNESEC